MLPKLESFVRDAIITQRPVPETLFREKTVWNYPEGAVRELVMNTCMHRDFQSNMPLRLYQFDDYIEVMNPGGLYGEARPENFPTVNDYRNPLVAEAMKVMKYVNKFNRGVAKVQEMLKENGNPQAKFDVETLTAFRVLVEATADNVPVNGGVNGDVSESVKEELDPQKKKNVGVYVSVNSKNGEGNGEDVGVNVGVKITDTQSKILDLIIHNPLITHKEMSQILSITERTAERSTKILRDLHIIKRDGSDKTGEWVILK